MTRPILAVAVLSALGLAAIAPPAAAQARQCGPRAAVIGTLASTYGETRRGIGTAGSQAVVELFASADTGTWTVTVTLPDGMTCLIASGAGWESLVEELPARGNPT
ncbi:MAG: hypothetical protein ACK4TB_16305 [Gemmobacter sp.]